MNSPAEVRNMQTQRSTVVRRAVLFGVPFLYLVLGLLHPANPELGDETALFIALHYAQLFLIGGLAYMFWLLVDGLDGRAAGVARALILPFVIVYTAVEASIRPWSRGSGCFSSWPACPNPRSISGR